MELVDDPESDSLTKGVCPWALRRHTSKCSLELAQWVIEEVADGVQVVIVVADVVVEPGHPFKHDCEKRKIKAGSVCRTRVTREPLSGSLGIKGWEGGRTVNTGENELGGCTNDDVLALDVHIGDRHLVEEEKHCVQGK